MRNVLAFAVLLAGCSSSPDRPETIFRHAPDKAEVRLVSLGREYRPQIVKSGGSFTSTLDFDEVNATPLSDNSLHLFRYSWNVSLTAPIAIEPIDGQSYTRLRYRVTRIDRVKGQDPDKVAAAPGLPGEIPVEDSGVAFLYPGEEVALKIPGSDAQLFVRLLPGELVTEAAR